MPGGGRRLTAAAPPGPGLPTLTLPAPRGGQQAHVLGVGGRLAFLIPKGLQELCTLNQQLFIIK